MLVGEGELLLGKNSVAVAEPLPVTRVNGQLAFCSGPLSAHQEGSPALT